jgi:hypothetical protein
MMTFFTNPEPAYSLLASTALAVGALRLCVRTSLLLWHGGDRTGRRTYRQTFVSIHLILFLVQAGCAASSPVIPMPSNEVREGFGTIAVATAEATPKVKFHAPKRVKGAGAAAGRTSGRALGKMWAGCGQVIVGTAPTIIVPILAAAGCVVATPLVAIGGALVGGGNSAAAEANRAASAARASEVKALRAVVEPVLTAVASEKPLHRRLFEQVGTERTQSAVTSVTKTGRPHYNELSRKGIDTVLEASVLRIDVSTENALVLTARVRLMRVADHEVLYAKTYTFNIAPRSVSEWTTDGGEALRAALLGGYQAFADEIVGDMFAKKHLANQYQQDLEESEGAGQPEQTATGVKNSSTPNTSSGTVGRWADRQ